ncbi:chromate efflux transporter [Candidatus Cyanaurora vandensis]|uniref:chromate efflux transporter n=1 Tax=Candidatus Cyanaurora vandensis TaxID=2714958 RepID=UPI00257B408D|nr:chromate efflux transporter [Candidatus Cyanaurora vandensis]
MSRLGEVALLFLKLGVIGFGGPAAHIALMEEEVVQRRGWLTPTQFLDLVGAVNLIPGPNSTELAIQIGYERAGKMGLGVAGVCFILPAVLLTGGLAWVYTTYGTLPQVAPVLAGIKPVILAVVLVALWRLLKKALKSWSLAGIALGVLLGSLAGLNEVLVLLVGGVAGLGLGARAVLILLPGVAVQAETTTPVSLGALGWFFFKVGSVLFGSGYVLVAFLEGLVRDYGWLTRQQLLDAIAVGQFTPGPVLSTATFIGYLIGGPGGAVVATVAIFLPSFIFVLLLNPLLPLLRGSPQAGAFLDGVNAGSLALMAAVVLKLLPVTVTDGVTLGLLGVSLVLLLRTQVNSVWLILLGAGVGWLVL